MERLLIFCIFLNSLICFNLYASDEEPMNIGDYREKLADDIIEKSKCSGKNGGFVYFKVGDEIFRYGKESPIKISRLKPRGEIKNKIQNGCKDYPYENVVLSYYPKKDEDNYKKVNIHRISVLRFSQQHNSTV